MTVIKASLSPLARKLIQEELRAASAALARNHETGGWLWAAQGLGWWRTEGLEISYASGPGDHPERGIGAIDYDVASLESVDEVMRREGLELAGMWHTHLHPDSDAPSETDMKRIDVLLERREEWGARTQRALELILTPAPGGEWTMHLWCFMRSKEPKMAGRTQLRPAGFVTLAEPAVMRETK